MSFLQPVRGARDVLPDEAYQKRVIENTFYYLAERYGFNEIITPILESTEVFKRTLGETSDIVTKEMYTFICGQESLTLRPEGTAGVVRAFISNGLHHSLPLKLFYSGPMFRHERPQRGRLRQFHQLGVELLGASNPLADAEIIAFASHFLTELGLDRKVTLELNSLGDIESRSSYRSALIAYLEKQSCNLSASSRDRLQHNPLRILDSKDLGDKAILLKAPVLTNFLTESSLKFLEQTCAFLKMVDITPVINPRLVRGLDYYCHVVFEFTTTELGSQGTVLAGGRYDDLIQQMGGPPVSGVGWAAGIERLALLMGSEQLVLPSRPTVIIALGITAENKSLLLAQILRRSGVTVSVNYANASLAKRLKQANKTRARAAVIIGDDELSSDTGTVLDLDSGEQSRVAFAEVSACLKKIYG